MTEIHTYVSRPYFYSEIAQWHLSLPGLCALSPLCLSQWGLWSHPVCFLVRQRSSLSNISFSHDCRNLNSLHFYLVLVQLLHPFQGPLIISFGENRKTSGFLKATFSQMLWYHTIPALVLLGWSIWILTANI